MEYFKNRLDLPDCSISEAANEQEVNIQTYQIYENTKAKMI